MRSIMEIQHKAQKVARETPEFASILIVDDQRFDRSRLKRMCGEIGLKIRVSEADSLNAMTTAIRSDTFDLIFLDLHLPDGSGLQGLEIVQAEKRNRHAATIMVTGDDQSEIAIGAMKSGCSDFLVKDVLSNRSVRRAALNALQKARLNRSLETQEAKRTNVEEILDRLARECGEEFKPLLFDMMRHIRDLGVARGDDDRYETAVERLKSSCDRLFDFLSDIENQNRKSNILSEFQDPRAQLENSELSGSKY